MTTQPVALPASARRRHRRLLPALLALAVAAVPAVVLTTSSPASAAPRAGWIRVAHLSPDTPKVDVYLTAFDDPDFEKVLPSVGYGALAPYQRVAPGFYSVSMRGAGAPADSPAVISTDIRVRNGGAYTVAGVGRNANLELRVLTDDLRAPGNRKARVRVVQASGNATVVDLRVVGGPAIASGAEFATTSDYTNVPAGRTRVRISPQEGDVPAVTKAFRLRGGVVYSLLVLDQRNGIKVELGVDSTSASGQSPVGGVETGLGGTATAPDRAATGSTGPLAVLGGLLAALLAGLWVGVVRGRGHGLHRAVWPTR